MSQKNVGAQGNRNHHLWNNNGTWWFHRTIYPTPITKQRIRQSLNTKDVDEARDRRDAILRHLTLEHLPLANNQLSLSA